MAQAAEKIELFDEDSDEALARQTATLREAVRIAEALLFAASEPLDEAEIARRLPDGADVSAVLARLREEYADRGVNLTRAGKKRFFRTAADLAWILARERVEEKKLSRAALETLAIIAYHQPTTRAEIEDIRGVAISKGTLDVLLETGWIRLRGRRRAPGGRSPTARPTPSSCISGWSRSAICRVSTNSRARACSTAACPRASVCRNLATIPRSREDEEPLEAAEAPGRWRWSFQKTPRRRSRSTTTRRDMDREPPARFKFREPEARGPTSSALLVFTAPAA